jgi:hypothetical protein
MLAHWLVRPLGAAALLLGVLAPRPATAQVGYVPSLGYLLLSSPFSPTSAEECVQLAARFEPEIRGLSQAHEQCLSDAPGDGGGPTCGRAVCQPLHSARDAASSRRSAEVGLCHRRVAEHLAREREEARRRQEQKARAEREAQEAERAAAERKRAEQERRAKESADQRARRDRDEARQRDEDRRREEARRRDERDRADARRADEQRRQDQERAERELRADRDRREAAERHAESRALAEIQARAEAEAAVKREKEEASYWDLINQVAETQKAGTRLASFAGNPFQTAGRLAAREMNKELLDGGLDLATPLGPEVHDERYDAATAVVGRARATALRGNPFAREAADVALHGIHRINRQVLGELDRTADAIRDFGRDDASRGAVIPAPSPLPSRLPAPSTGHGTDQAGAPDERVIAAAPPVPAPSPLNPVAAAPSAGPRMVVADPPPAAGRSTASPNPFAAGSGGRTYYDPETRQTFRIPPGHTLIRDPKTRQLTVVRLSEVPLREPGDSLAGGSAGCGASGVGAVTPECEEARRKARNPFGAPAR